MDPPVAKVTFPSAGSRPPSGLFMSDVLSQPTPQQHLPFRRISLPTPPSIANRMSVVSTASFDSLPEQGPLVMSGSTGGIGSGGGGGSALAMSSVVRAAQRASRNNRPTSLMGPDRRNARKREVKIVDSQSEIKRRKVIDEFYDTERSYVEGLELIYSHFLTPIIASLDTANPLLDRNELTTVFSNFIDIWNLHRSFFSSLTGFLHTSTSQFLESSSLPPLSPLLLSHFPYLSLYTPFVTSFPNMLSSYHTLLTKNPAFASFIAKQEADPRCGKLKLRDWLLTVVQRCPRYLLLLKDLISCTDPDDPEAASLTEVQSLVSKITSGLDSSLQTHAQTLSLLALQRTTSGLPFRLVTPGRAFIKRGPLLQLEGSKPKDREFLLFSDCLVWIASADKPDDADLAAIWELSLSTSGDGISSVVNAFRPALESTSSTSDVDISRQQQQQQRGVVGSSEFGKGVTKRKESILKLKLPSSASKKKVRRGSSATEERWVYKGHVDLVNLEVVVPPTRESADSRRLEFLSPASSFAVYTSTEEEREQWCNSIRDAKSSLLVSLYAMRPNSTLTSSVSTQHLRQALQAIPYSPEEEPSKPKRGRVEHFVPAIWIPDGKTESCMRCGRTFGWRRRRHHCRLCGRCICASCSDKTFFILDPDAKTQRKPARACNACYDTVFPLLSPEPVQDPEGEDLTASQTAAGTVSHLTLSGLRSMPSLLLPDHSIPSALMAIGRRSSPKRLSRSSSSRLEDFSSSATRGGVGGSGGIQREPSGSETSITPISASPTSSGMPAIRIRASSVRPRSYVQILEDFHQGDDSSILSQSPSSYRSGGGLNHSGVSIGIGGSDTNNSVLSDMMVTPIDEGSQGVPVLTESAGGPSSTNPTNASSPPPPPLPPSSPRSPRSPRTLRTPRKPEDTARRHKRFSLPASVAIQATPVMVRPSPVGEGKSKRFSLVLGKSLSSSLTSTSTSATALTTTSDGGKDGEVKGGGGGGNHSVSPSSETTNSGLLSSSSSAAIGKLSELLGRSWAR